MSGTRRKPGEMGPFIDGFEERLLDQGYTSGTIRNCLKLVGHLGKWMRTRAWRPRSSPRARSTPSSALDELTAVGARRVCVPSIRCSSTWMARACCRQTPLGHHRSTNGSSRDLARTPGTLVPLR